MLPVVLLPRHPLPLYIELVLQEFVVLHSPQWQEGMLPAGPVGENLAKCWAGRWEDLPNLGSFGCRAPGLVVTMCAFSLSRDSSGPVLGAARASSLLPASGLLPTPGPIPHPSILHPLLSEFTQFINPTGGSSPLPSHTLGLSLLWAPRACLGWTSLDSGHLHFSFPPPCVYSSIFLWQVSTYFMLDAESTEWKRYPPLPIPAHCEL